MAINLSSFLHGTSFGTLPVANGGTGSTTLTLNNVLLGNGTNAVQAVAPGATGNVLISNGTTWISGSAATASLPTQTGNSGGYLTTNGTTASWGTSTGSGNVVLSTSPTLVTPNLGTPSTLTLTNATGLPISTGISGLAAGIATFLATPSSANLISAVTDETGTGALVFATSPTLVTPLLGTPTSGNFSTGTFTWPTFNQSTTGSAATLTTARNISASGDATWTVSFNGSADASATLTLANVVTAGTGTKLTYNAKGLVTGSSTLTVSDISDISTTYQGLNANLTSVAALSTSSTGLVKLTNGTASLDTSSYLVSGGALGTPTSGDLSNATNAVAYGIKTATNTVSVSAATAPSVGQALVATSATTATWQTVSAGGSSLPTQTGNTGKYLTTDGTNASWAVVSGGLTSTAVSTSAYTAVAYDLVRANTTSGSFTVTFPTSPADGAQIGVIDIAKTFGSYPLTITPGAGTTIEGDTTGVLLDINGTFAAFVYTSALTNWRLMNIPATTNAAYNNGTLYPTNVVTSAYSASSNEIVRCNTSGGAFSVTFPAVPLDGAIIGIVDINNTFAINNLTILPAGKTIEGDVTSYVLDMSSVYVSFIYSSSTGNWRLLETPTASPTASIGKSIAMSIAFGG
jgi:hypothetical protein